MTARRRLTLEQLRARRAALIAQGVPETVTTAPVRADAAPYETNGLRVRWTFDSFSAFLDQVERPIPADAPRRSHASRDGGATYASRDGGYQGADWHGTATWEEAMRLARTGWPEGRAHVERIAARITDTLTASLAPVQRFEASVFGPILDVDAYLHGDPEPFYMVEDDETARRGAGPIVRILANLGSSGAVTGETKIMRGAALVALADCLERAGRRVEITATICVSNPFGKDAGVDALILVKRPEESLQIEQVAFALANPATHRRLGWALREQAPAAVREAVGVTITGGYGRSTSVPSVGYDITLPAADALAGIEWADEDAAVKWVQKILKEQGVVIADA